MKIAKGSVQHKLWRPCLRTLRPLTAEQIAGLMRQLHAFPALRLENIENIDSVGIDPIERLPQINVGKGR